MKCSKCNHEVKRPLMLFNNTLACDNIKCLKQLVEASMEFKVTEANEELFNMSEAAFFKGLKEDNAKYINRATELCSEALDRNHPKACLRMGYYYDKAFMETNNTEKFRVLMAYEYYALVCDSTINGKELGGGSYDMNKIRETAGNLMLEMLANFPQGASIDQKYTVDYNYTRLISKIPTLKKPDGFKTISTISGGELLENTLNGVIGGTNNAIFGIVKCDNKELIPYLENKKSGIWKSKGKTLTLKCYVNGNSSVTGLSNDKALTDLLAECRRAENNNEVYMIFYNKKPKLNYLKKKALAGFELNYITASHESETNIKEIILNIKDEQNSLIFYEDDIYYVRGNNKAIDREFVSHFKEYIGGEMLNG